MALVEPARLRCVLDVVDGPSRRVGAGGVLIGRQGDCDIVARDPSVSRRHALIRLTVDGVELVPLGRAPIEVNRAPIERPCGLADGDEVRLPGLALTVAISLPRPEPGPCGFVLERARGGSFGVTHTPFLIGGGERDDLIVKAWPPRALVLHSAQGELFLEVGAGPVARNGVALDGHALATLAPGDVLECRGERLVVGVAGGDPTTAVAGAALPSRIEIELLPRGGRVVLTTGALTRAVYLADRRFDLLVALARPPAGHAAGDWISDDVLRGVVWPRRQAVPRPEINMLISRCRRDLLDAGIAGPRLLERAPGGGATRLAVAPGAEILVKS